MAQIWAGYRKWSPGNQLNQVEREKKNSSASVWSRQPFFLCIYAENSDFGAPEILFKEHQTIEVYPHHWPMASPRCSFRFLLLYSRALQCFVVVGISVSQTAKLSPYCSLLTTNKHDTMIWGSCFLGNKPCHIFGAWSWSWKYIRQFVVLWGASGHDIRSPCALPPTLPLEYAQVFKVWRIC